MNRAQRVAATAALAVALAAVGWTVLPMSANGAGCGSAVTAAFGDDPPATRDGPAPVRGGGFNQSGVGTVTRYPCSETARSRLVVGGMLVGLAGAFAVGSFFLLRDARPAVD